MTKVSRTFRLDQELSKALDKITVYPITLTYHVEQALAQYKPIKMLSPQTAPPLVDVDEVRAVIDKSVDDKHWNYVWDLYGKKGNHKTSKARYFKLSDNDKELCLDSLPAYVQSTPEKKYRKGFESYINLECWNDEVTTNAENQRPNQSGRPSVVDRVKQVNIEREEARRAEERALDGQAVGEAARDIRPSTTQPVRSDDTGELGETLEGSYSRAD
jgi:hypothetical protein